MRFPEGKSKVFTMSYDDGVYQDIRLVEIMTKHKLKGTFNINSGYVSNEDAVEGSQRLSSRQVKELYIPNGQEVALHTYTHTLLTDLPFEHITYEYLKDKEELENILGCIIRGSAYPYSKYNEKVLNSLRACGVAYARAGDQTEEFSLPTDWLRFRPTARHKTPKLFDIANKFLDLIVQPNHPCAMFSLMGHSYEFDRDNNWDLIETFAEKMEGHKDVWYATNIEIYDYIQAFQSVRYNLAQTIAENPTSIDVWINKNGKVCKIPAGQTIRI